jgi:hypothetical protein
MSDMTYRASQYAWRCSMIRILSLIAAGWMALSLDRGTAR